MDGVDLGLRRWSAKSARPRRWLTPAGLARTAAALAAVLALATGGLAAAGSDVSASALPGILAFSWMGGVLLARRPGHPIGPLLCLLGLADAVSALAFAYSRYALVVSPGSLPFARAFLWATNWDDGLSIALGGLVLPLVFPDGRLLSRRWRPVLWAAIAFIPLWIAGYAFVPESASPYLKNLPNPYAVSSADRLFEAVQALALACGLFVVVAGAVSMALRWRRAGRMERQQLKWYLAVLPLIAGSLVVYEVNSGLVSLIVTQVAAVLLPVAIGVAVLRYRLYEIDILLNRAVLYGLLTVMVAVVYLAVVGAARWLFGVDRSLALEVLATVLAAAALWPLRDRVQRRVDRLFYGDRGAPYEALARLGRRLEEAAEPESALDSVVKTIADGHQPRT